MKVLKPSTSCRVDGITARLLKAAGPSIYPIILHICNLSISQSEFPSPWKIGCVTPLHKSGDLISPNNYRPISVIPCLGKLLKRLIHNRTTAYLTRYNLLSLRQSGFRKGYSTGTCLIDFLHHIFTNMDKRCASGKLFLDLQKAFDTVHHGILVDKLCLLGFHDRSVEWFVSYLSNRKQVTKVNGVISDESEINFGCTTMVNIRTHAIFIIHE